MHAAWPGSVNDQRLFTKSPFCDLIRQGQILQEHVISLEGQRVKSYNIRDAGYTMTLCTVISYPGPSLPAAKLEFNFKHSSYFSTRMCIEKAFGRLKGRFRFLNGTLLMRMLKEHGMVLFTACILHSILMDQNDVYLQA